MNRINGLRGLAALLLAMAIMTCALPGYAQGGIFSDDRGNEVNALDGLVMKLTPAKADRYDLRVSVRISNGTSRSFDYGADFALEYKLNGRWQRLSRGTDEVPAVGYYLKTGRSAKMNIRITNAAGEYGGYGMIQPGEYRLVAVLADADTGEKFPIAAEFTVTEDSYLYATEPVNLRTGPGMRHMVLRELEEGEKVSYIAKKGNWTMVRTYDGVGYVFSKYLTKKPYEPERSGIFK